MAVNPILRGAANFSPTATELALLARPGLQPAILQTFGALVATRNPAAAIGAGVQTFALTDAGRAFGVKAGAAITPMLEQATKYPAVASHWAKLTEVAAKPGYISGLVTKSVGDLGPKAGPAVGKFTEELLHIATTK